MAEFHVYFSWRRQMPLFALKAPPSRRTQSALQPAGWKSSPQLAYTGKPGFWKVNYNNGVCFWHVRLKRFSWILQFSFKLKRVLQSDPLDRRVVNCLQWLLCVALCFRRPMNCLTKTCLNDLTKKVFSYFESSSFFKRVFFVCLFCIFGFDAFHIIYVYLTNFKE